MEDRAEQRQKRRRRRFTDEFKAGAARLVLIEGKSVTAVARELDLTASSLSRWVEQAKADQGTSKRGTLTTEEKEELARLRKEVRELRLEREILKNHLTRRAPSVAPETPSLVASTCRGSGRPLFGAVEPVKKHGPGMVADLKVVTPSQRSRLGN